MEIPDNLAKEKSIMFTINCLLTTTPDKDPLPDEDPLYIDVLGNKNVAGTHLDINTKSGCAYN
jgi:hypothetical protein